MATSDLSTPQKILRQSIKAKLPPAPSPPDFAPPPPPVPPKDNDTNEAEHRRMERIKLGRESLERRRRQGNSLSLSRSSSIRADEDGDIFMDRDGSRDETPPSSTSEVVVVRKVARGAKKDEGDAPYVPDADDEDDDEDEMRTKSPRRSERKFTKAAIQKENEQEKKRRLREKREKEELRSRFIEGSMRDRASAPPPKDIIGEVDDSEDEDENPPVGMEEDTPPIADQDAEKEKEKKKRGFTFGLGNLFRFNPFALVDEARAAYIRQRAIHDARERQKEEMKRQKKEAEELYFAMKRRGEFRGTFVQNDDDTIGRAVSTDDAVDFSNAGGSARKRKRGEVASVGSEMDAMPEYFHTLSGDEDNDEADDGDAMDEDTEPDEPEVGEEDVMQSIRFEETTAPPSQAESKEDKRKSVRQLVKKTSNVFNALTSSSTNNSSVSLINSTTGKPLTKREIKKQERLQKKVSNLEEQLEKARRELEEAARGYIPPVPDIPSELMAPPPPPPHSTPVSRSSQGSKTHSRANSMPPPPVPSMKGALPDTPKEKLTTRHPNQMLPDTPEPTPTGDRFAPGVMSPAADEDTTMDEGFSMVPLSPVLNSSSIADSAQQSGTLGVSKVRRTHGNSPGLSAFRKISGASSRKVSSVISSTVTASTATGNKPERKKRRGMDSPPPKGKSWAAAPAGDEKAPPPVPKLPTNTTGQ
ncbi:hypothetical protein K440DRAFT_661903 [Wilcoxina mikolae CBS 423.85]|nr:hypothetical protein K440DRAFT_661903 [Wilcoxina mikolae CBS 423.85]